MRPGGIPYNSQNGKAPPKRVPFTGFRILVRERVRISLVEVHERVGKFVITVGKKDQKGYQMHFMAVKKLRKCSGFVIYPYIIQCIYRS